MAALIAAALCAARLYLAVDHPTDQLTALIVAWPLAVVAFWLVVPNDVFPISYRGGRKAHLDIGGRRGAAIVTALDHQLGLAVTGAEPFGLEASAGSTPLRLQVRGPDGTGTVLFGKLYALNHLRSDRWYKRVRAVVYGRLEDEKPFSTVRRLVEYEDHLLRLMRDAGLPTPRPYGFVEMTPEREYLIVMEFLEGSQEIRDAPVDDRVYRRRAARGAADVGHGSRPPRHQAVEHPGPGRPRAAHRRGVRRGAADPVAAGGGPGQHDAHADPGQHPGSRLRTGAACLRRRRRGRSLRRVPEHHRPQPAAVPDTCGRARPDRVLPPRSPRCGGLCRSSSGTSAASRFLRACSR